MSTYHYTNNNQQNEEFMIYHTPYPLEEDRKKYEIPFKWFLFDFCKAWLLSAVCLSICAIAIWGAMSLLVEYDRLKEYESTFTIPGTCVCIDRESYDGESCAYNSDGLATNCYYWVDQEFEWIISNHSLCGDTLREQIFMTDRRVDTNADPWVYNINETIKCYSNPTCDTLSIDGDLHYNGNEDNALFAPILLITLTGCFFICCFPSCAYEMFALVTCRSYEGGPCCLLFTVQWMRSSYTQDLRDYNDFKKGVFSAIHNEREWFNMPFDGKIDYFMNYYGREYKCRMHRETNDCVNEYWPWCDYTVYQTWNVEEMMVWIGSVERNRFKRHENALKSYFGLKSIKSGKDLVEKLRMCDKMPYGMSDKEIRKLREHVMDLEDGRAALYAYDERYFEISLHDEEQIETAEYEEQEIRASWEINDLCLIFSRSKDKWFIGKIKQIDHLNKVDELTIVYGKHNGRTKKVNRNHKDVKPYSSVIQF
eukprot:101757_1